MALKDVHVLIPGTCEYVYITWQRYFTDVIKSNILRLRGSYYDYVVGLM